MRYLGFLIVVISLVNFCLPPRHDYIYLHRKIELPYVYYHFSGGEGGGKVPAYAPWDAPQAEFKWQKEKMHLFTASPELKQSYAWILAGNANAAITLLNNTISSAQEGQTELALLYNNLAIALLLKNKIRQAKQAINQAGIFLSENQTILDNARLITSFLQKKIQIVKYIKTKDKIKNDIEKDKEY